jgi:hypothetical protein
MRKQQKKTCEILNEITIYCNKIPPKSAKLMKFYQQLIQFRIIKFYEEARVILVTHFCCIRKNKGKVISKLNLFRKK